jgi:hypothetical protein
LHFYKKISKFRSQLQVNQRRKVTVDHLKVFITQQIV